MVDPVDSETGLRRSEIERELRELLGESELPQNPNRSSDDADPISGLSRSDIERELAELQSMDLDDAEQEAYLDAIKPGGIGTRSQQDAVTDLGTATAGFYPGYKAAQQMLSSVPIPGLAKQAIGFGAGLGSSFGLFNSLRPYVDPIAGKVLEASGNTTTNGENIVLPESGEAVKARGRFGVEKQSLLGETVGGAIGAFTPVPGATIAGGILGGQAEDTWNRATTYRMNGTVYQSGNPWSLPAPDGLETPPPTWTDQQLLKFIEDHGGPLPVEENPTWAPVIHEARFRYQGGDGMSGGMSGEYQPNRRRVDPEVYMRGGHKPDGTKKKKTDLRALTPGGIHGVDSDYRSTPEG